MTAAVMKACFRHRYSELLEQGLVDDSTKIIEKELLDSYVAQGRNLKQIKKLTGIEPEDIKSIRRLECQLLANEREAAVARLSESYDAPDMGDDVEPVVEPDFEDVRPDKAAIFMFADGNGGSALHTALATRWCREKGIEICPPMVGGSIDSAGLGHGIRNAIQPIEGMDPTMLVIWTDQNLTLDDFDWLRSYCAGRDIRIVPIGDMPSLWKGIRWGPNTIPKKLGPWMELRWAHIPETAKGVSRNTRVANIEDVMDCARLAIPYCAVAEAIGVSEQGIIKALISEGMLQDYIQAFKDTLAELKESEHVRDGPRNRPTVSQSTLEQVSSEAPFEGAGAPPSSPPVAPPCAPLPEITDSVTDSVTSEPPSSAPSEDVPEAPSEVVGDRERERSDKGAEVIGMEFPMMTVSGAKSLISTINDGAAPDTDLWSEVADGFSVSTYRLNLLARDGHVYYCVGVACQVLKAVYTPAKETVYFDRMGRIYALDGFLALRMADWSAVEVPIVSDAPVNAKRWIA